MAYATPEELNEFLGKTPLNAQQLLDRASRDVDRALITAVYDTTKPEIVKALNEATLEQIATDLDSKKRAGGFTIGRLSVQASTKNAPGAPRRIGVLWEPAFAVLQAAGLTGHGPQSG